MQASAPNYYGYPGLSPMRLRHHDKACAEFRTGRVFRYRILIGGETFAEGTIRAQDAKRAAIDVTTCLFSKERRTVGAEVQAVDAQDSRLLAAARAERRTYGGDTVTTWQSVDLPEPAPLAASAPALPASVAAPAPA